MAHHANVPVFIPHMGCPNNCVFCDQRAISGQVKFDEGDVERIIIDSLGTLEASGRSAVIAFFGGSFTGIDRPLMIRLLDIAQSYVGRGVLGIRMSTRPDYIDPEIIKILDSYTVSQVELGIQSMSDRVLAVSKRGHTADDTRRAVELLRENGFSVVGQMMVGLPASAAEDELFTAREICRMGCDGARIYPTVVFRNTELQLMCDSGAYTPLSIEEAAVRCADVLEIFEENGVECLRIGLCDSENLHSEEKYYKGPAHPAMGELVRGELWRRRISHRLAEGRRHGEVVIEVPRGCASAAAGQNKRNRREYEKLCGGKVTIRESRDLYGRQFKVYDRQEADEVCI